MSCQMTVRSMGLPGRKTERRAREEQETRRNMPSRPVRSKPTLLKRAFQMTAIAMDKEGRTPSYCQMSNSPGHDLRMAG